MGSGRYQLRQSTYHVWNCSISVKCFPFDFSLNLIAHGYYGFINFIFHCHGSHLFLGI
nr:MAG TPA: hypothetical protein [Caudoviricetes sp.]